MADTNSPPLSGLEHQITSLLQSCETLKAENQALRRKLSSSLNERAELIEKTQTVQTRIKKIIAKLKEHYHE